jgi:hypothetical protein
MTVAVQREVDLREVHVTAEFRSGHGKAVLFADITVEYHGLGWKIFGCAIWQGEKGLSASLPKKQGTKKGHSFDVLRIQQKQVWEHVMARIALMAQRWLDQQGAEHASDVHGTHAGAF